MNRSAKVRPSWRTLVRLPEAELSRYDIAAVNLACADDLPGSDAINVEYCLNRLDEWATVVQRQTLRSMPKFRKRPEHYGVFDFLGSIKEENTFKNLDSRVSFMHAFYFGRFSPVKK